MNAVSLRDVIAEHGLSLSDESVARLAQYCQQLWSFNERVNLTRHLDYQTFVARDLIDTLQLSQLLVRGERVLDVGSGGGVPGLVLAILRPDLEVSLCESVQKKARVLSEMAAQLDLEVPIYAERVEQVLQHARFDTLVARAVGPTWRFLSWVRPHWGAFRRVLLIKGPRWVEERQQARHRGQMRGVEMRRLASYATPGHDAESVILGFWAKENDRGLAK